MTPMIPPITAEIMAVTTCDGGFIQIFTPARRRTVINLVRRLTSNPHSGSHFVTHPRIIAAARIALVSRNRAALA